MTFSVRAAATALAAVVLAVCLAGCADDDASGGDDPSIEVVAAFYPLEFLAERVGGDRVSVTTLTKPGAEPHDLELTARDVAAIADAELVAYLSGFQPAVDDAVESEAAGRSWDAAESADLTITFTPIEEGVAEADEAGAVDPHFWLDPLRYADVADALATRLGALDADGAEDFTANAAALRGELEALDEEWVAGTTTCESRDLVTSHNAFGYLAQRYGFEQLGVTGLTPEDEPTPESLATTADFVRDNDVRTIYFETLVSPAVADTLAAETGAQTRVLDPLEGLTDESAGDDYLAVMGANLDSVRAGQPCS